MNVLFMVGSLREGSYNRALAETAIRLLPDGVTATEVTRIAEIPHYSEDLDVDTPDAVRILRTEVAEADAIVVVTPEYNGAMSSVVKNAIDWVSRPRESAAISGKPALVLSASQSPRAGQWARENATRVLTVAGAAPRAESIGVPDAYRHFVDGALTDEALRSELASALAELLPARVLVAA